MAGSLAQPRPVRRRDDLRRHARWAYAIAAVALAAGALLLPRGDELLLIHVRNHDVGRAREVLADAVNQGVSTTASVVAHGELFLFEGRVDEAITEMEAYALARPDDQATWSHLADLYQNAQRLHDRVRALANVYRLSPSDPRARELAALYRRINDERAEAGVLADLVRTGRASAAEYVRAARLEAAFGHGDEARRTLEALRRREPRAFEYPVMELYASLLSESGRTDLLARYFQPLPVAREEPDLLASLASAMKAWGDTDGAVALLEPLPQLPPAPVLLAALARTAQGTAHAGRIAAKLATLDTEHPLGAEPLGALVSLALSVSDYDLAERVLTREGRTADPAVVASAIGTAVAAGRRDWAQHLIARLGDGSLAESPILALDLAVERGDEAAADRWIALVDRRNRTTPDETAALAQFEIQLSRDAHAFKRLVALARTGKAPAWALTDLVTVAERTGRVDETLAVLGRTSSTVPEARAAWVRLAVATGRTALLEAWLSEDTSRAADAAALRDVFFALSDRADTGLAAEAAARLFHLTGRDEDGLRLGQALLAAGKPLEALGPLRAVARSSADARTAYDSALHAAAAAGLDVALELKPVFEARLRTAGLPAAHRAMIVEGLWLAGERASLYGEILGLAAGDLDRWLSPLVESALAKGTRDDAVALVAGALGSPSQPVTDRRETLLRALIDLGAPDAVVVPHLERFAADRAENWVYAYDERLAALGRTSERVRLWTTVGTAADASAEARRGAASRLHELGAARAAAAVIEPLAAAAGPADADVESLLFFWGPSPSPENLAWLAGRLRTAPEADQPAWISRLVNAGGARDAIAGVPVLPDTASPAYVEAWIGAHRAVRDPDLLRSAVRAVLAREAMPVEGLLAAARAALAEGQTDLALEAFRAAAASRPHDVEVMQWLGVLSFYAGRTGDARRWLDAYRAAGGDEAEPLYQLGELALAARDDVRAREYFTRALARLPATGASANPGLRANVLVRLGRREEAAAAFEAMLAANPRLDHIRADFVVALFQWGDLGRAKDVLDAAAPAASGGADASREVTGRADASGARRLDLLRVQWLTAAGRYPQALALLDRLAARDPADPDVLVARARFDAERGRPADADRAYAAARLEAPAREDIRAIVSDRERLRAPGADLRTDSRSIRDGWRTETNSVALDVPIAPYTRLAVAAETIHLSAPQLLHANGDIHPVDARQDRVDATLTAPIGPGTTVAGSLFAASGGAGAGATLTRYDLYGTSRITAEIGRPLWDFPESVAGGGRRDRMGVERQLRLGAETSAWLLAHWNRYRLASGPRLDSGAFTFGIVRSVRRAAPTVTLQYGLDVERRLRATSATAPDGRTFTPVPIASREVHVVGAISRFDAALWQVEAAAGYTVDRLGGRGSFVTAHLTPPPAARLGVELWAERRLYLLSTAQHEFHAGAALKVRF